MKKLLFCLITFYFAAVNIQAEVLCIKKKVPVVNGKINLGRSVKKVAGTTCPSRTKLITNLSGMPNEAGETPNLASGKLLVGSFTIADHASSGLEAAAANISFPVNIGASAPVSVIPIGGPSSTECPGSATAPDAAQGHFCLYINDRTNVSFIEIFDIFTNMAGTVSPLGASLTIYSTGPLFYYLAGTWAVRTAT
jgi:hypothetical protein